MILGGDPTALDNAHAEEFESLVHQLDDPSFHVRSHAAQRLIAIAVDGPPGDAGRVIETLRRMQSDSTESRLAAREILLEISQQNRHREINRLLNPRITSDKIQLDGWRAFRASAGDDMSARRLFAMLSQQYPRWLRQIESGGPGRLKQLDELDPFHLPAEDAIGWAMLLLLDLHSGAAASEVSKKVATTLSSSAMGPSVTARRQAEVLRRLIDSWVRSPTSNVTVRQRLLIAMRYRCRDSANHFCERIFAQREVPAPTCVTALLCAAALGRADVESEARIRLADRRTAHVWQLIPSNQTRIRTQVADVALAVLLRQHGVDPRIAGFAETQADPILVYRAHSLGFPDESSRRRAQEKSESLLGAPLLLIPALFDR